jgi:hypothetical protein
VDRTELINKLENFKQACFEIGCISSNNAFDLEEAYPGAEPNSYIINVAVTQNWLDKDRSTSALRELIDLLYEKVESETLKSVLTLRLCQEDQFNTVQKEVA